MDTVFPAASPDRQALCRLDEIPDGGATAVDAMLTDGEADPEQSSLILLRRGGQVRGYLNVCPHTGRRLDYAPGKFLLKNDTLICAVHGATFNQADGLCIAGPCRGEHLREVALQVQDGAIHLAPRVTEAI
ncbi:Rieske (2Fe-2S) protein [Rhodanobacter terrae]|uniref:Rieske (2Fe-2S) protein n=1 Tax=Rhodanobacter terrae TaxID=418647 RepID=A0ABW0SXB4_9GAMM